MTDKVKEPTPVDLSLLADAITTGRELTGKARAETAEREAREEIERQALGREIAQQALDDVIQQRDEVRAALVKSNEKFAMHTAEVSAWLSLLAQELGGIAPDATTTVKDACEQILRRAFHLESERKAERDTRQADIAEWAAATFGREQQSSVPQRALRLLEEAIEAYQAAGCDEAMAHKLVSFVFACSSGKIAQELGGVGVCVLLLAEAAGVSADSAEAAETARVMSKPIEHFRARNEAKNAAGFLALAALPASPSDKGGVITAPEARQK